MKQILCVLGTVAVAIGAAGQTLERRVAEDAGSKDAPLLFCIGMHIEPFGSVVSTNVTGGQQPRGGRPGPDYNRPMFFERHVTDIRRVAEIIEKNGGCMTVQAQTPFTRVAAESGDKVLADLAKSGHEVALHLHEDAHLGRVSENLTVGTWVSVIREELSWLDRAGAPKIRYWSGGNLYRGVLDAMRQSGLDVMSDYKNPRIQQSDPRLLAINPWRPAGGPAEGDLTKFCEHDAAGKIVYLPDGIFARTDHAGMRRSQETGGDWSYFDFLTDGLERSLRAARPDLVNVFHFTIHAGEFRGQGGEPFAVIDAWLRDVLSPLVKSGKVRWATFSKMADEYAKWEKANPGVDPRGPTTRGEAAVKSQSAMMEQRGSITFAVNVHDWLLVDDSADTLLRLVGIFEKHGVRGDFYFTAPVVERYVEERPDVIERIKKSGMGISYHCRAPHPLWKAFGDRLRGKSEDEMAAILRDYETFQLDLKTGALNREKPGGYRYVEKIFGTKPVTVGSADAPPEMKSVSSRVYAELGAQAGVFYHETGTRMEMPFEFRDGLMVRPSDFSITRFESPGSGEGQFWWNMQGTPRAAEFDPVALLKKRLAEWSGPRPPIITALIHENDFYRQGGPGWGPVYFEGDGPRSRPRSPPFDTGFAPDKAKQRAKETKEAIFAKYEELVSFAAKNLRVVTSGDLVAMARNGRLPEQQAARQDRTGPGTAPPRGRPDQNGQPGPWDNDVAVYRIERSGQATKLELFERAGVPTIARMKDGRIVAAFQNFPKDDDRDFDRVAVRFSSDEGRTWTKAEPIAVEGMEAGLARPFDPTLVPLPDGRIRLYFTSNRNVDFRMSTPEIHSAVSSNGVHFMYEPGVRFAIENRIVIDCAVALHNGTFHMIVPDNGTADDMQRQQAGGRVPVEISGYQATSKDGLNFTRLADVKLDGSGRWLGNMQSDDGNLVFFGSGGGPGSRPGLWRATSADGKSWKLDPERISVQGADPGAVRLRDRSWLLVVTTPPRPGTPGAQRMIRPAPPRN